MRKHVTMKKETLWACLILLCLLLTGCDAGSGTDGTTLRTTEVERNASGQNEIEVTDAVQDEIEMTCAVQSEIEMTGAGQDEIEVTDAGQNEIEMTGTVQSESETSDPIDETTFVEQKVVISEILSSNSGYMEHEGDRCDMIEIANTSDTDIDLFKYYISDTPFNPMKARLQGTIPAGGFAVFYCVGDTADAEKNELPFKISSSGETLVLSTDNGRTIETVTVPALEKNTGYARNENGEFAVTSRLTFGSANKFADEQTILPDVSPADGTRGTGTLTITFDPREGTEIFYTLDGSVPMGSSDRYDKPISIEKTTTIRILVRNGEEEAVASYTFFVGEPDAALDDVCIGIGTGDLSDLNAYPHSKRRYPVSFAMYREGVKVFDETCGMNATGNTSAVYDKKSYRLKFSKEFGASRLRYKVFDDLDIDSFDSLVLRGGSQDNEDVIIKDELVPKILRQGNLVDGVLTTHYRPVNLYIDGEYRGLYYIREHIDGHMIASHYGCAHEDVTIVEQCVEVKCGSAGKEWTGLWDYVAKNDLRDPDVYEYVSSRVSLESVADYYIIQIWLHNIDPDNVRVYKVGDDKWRYALYDLDLTLTDDGTNGAAFMLGWYNTGLYTFNALVYKLLQNHEFMELFLSRMQLLFTTILSEEKVVAIVDSFVAGIDHDMERSCGLWGPRKDSSGGVYYINYSTWKRRIEQFKSRFKGRTSLVASEFVRLKGVSDELVRKYLSEIIK